MIRTLLLLLALSFAPAFCSAGEPKAEPSADDEVVVAYVSYNYNSQKVFLSEITAKALDRTPPWRDSSPNPPLSARDAIRLADAMRGKLVRDTKSGNWERAAAELREARDNRWYWLIRYEFCESGTGPVPDLILLVLMDGTVVQPRIRPERQFFLAEADRSGRLVSPASYADLSGDDITDETMARLKDWRHLSELMLVNSAVTDQGFKHLKDLTQLKRLDLVGSKITDEGLEGLEGLVKLEQLSIDGAKITDKGLVHFRGLSRLKTLELEDCGITGAGLENLKGLSRLKTLHLNDTRVTGTGLENLKGLRRLTFLQLCDAQITDTEMIRLEGLKQVQDLNLSGNQLTDKGLKSLAGLKQLKWLRLYGTDVTDEGVQMLKKALPDCEVQK